MTRRRAVFLDRDGVLNRAIVRDGKPYAPMTLAEFEIFPEAPAAMAKLKERRFLLVVVSNQPEVKRGHTDRATVESIDRALMNALPLDEIFVCYHDDIDGCECRKPRPGLLLQAAAKYSIDLPASFLIGDRWRDIDAGAAAGCKTVLIDYGYRDKQPEHNPDVRVASLREAVDWILEQATSTPAP